MKVSTNGIFGFLSKNDLPFQKEGKTVAKTSEKITKNAMILLARREKCVNKIYFSKMEKTVTAEGLLFGGWNLREIGFLHPFCLLGRIFRGGKMLDRRGKMWYDIRTL
ncbi:MAG: hypothetical protein IIV17_03365 [Clostridia bacterium]|nr:hypothetical protein [Clostridia bacterium]